MGWVPFLDARSRTLKTLIILRATLTLT